LADWSERWFPDPFAFALIGVVVLFAGGVLVGEQPAALAIEGGKSFWSLVPFTMQMVMVIVGGYVVASAPLAARLIQKTAAIPKTTRGAVAWVAFFSMATSLVSWGLSLIFSAMLVRELARRMKGLDYRAAGAAGYLGLGTVWAMGLSSSSALLMATKAAMPAKLYEMSGVIPLDSTIFLRESMIATVVLIATATLVAYLSAPGPERAVTAESLGIQLTNRESDVESRTRPGDWLEFSPLPALLIVALLSVYLVDVFRTSPRGILAALDLNTYNLLFLTLGMLLQWRPHRFVRAVSEALQGATGVIIQFPLYAMIFGMISGTGLSEKLAKLFVSASTPNTYPLLVALYSATLGILIPSGGSKWIVEAPYVMQAAIEHRIHLGWVVQIYNASEALPNLINPFYMLPLLGILKLRARDLAGYGMLQLIVQAPLVLFLCWLFSRILIFTPPSL
jgi:short-chain fatty acids transporter